MSKKAKTTLFSSVLLLALGFISLQLFKNKMNQDIQSYLLHQRDYSIADIKKIYTRVGKAPLVSTTVIFNDDTDNRYFYRKENGQIYQYSMAPVHGVDDGHTQYKHKEK